MTYEYFIALPMSSLYMEEFKKIKLLAQKILVLFEENNIPVYCAIDGSDQFTNSDEALKADMYALYNSKNFILIYPKNVQSSVIFEAGVAYAENKPSTYFVQKVQDLPYIMRHSKKVRDNIEIVEYKNSKDILKNIKTLIKI